MGDPEGRENDIVVILSPWTRLFRRGPIDYGSHQTGNERPFHQTFPPQEPRRMNGSASSSIEKLRETEMFMGRVLLEMIVEEMMQGKLGVEKIVCATTSCHSHTTLDEVLTSSTLYKNGLIY